MPEDLETRPRVPDLVRAAAHGALDEVRALLEGGVAPDSADHLGWTALHAVAFSGSVPCVEALLRAGAKPSLSAVDRWQPLHLAAFAAHDAVIERLVTGGADLTQRLGSPLDWSPLSCAAAAGHGETFALLRRLGAEPRLRDVPRYLRARYLASGRALRFVKEALIPDDYAFDQSEEPEVWEVLGDLTLTTSEWSAIEGLVQASESELVTAEVIFRRVEAFDQRHLPSGSNARLETWEDKVLTPLIAPHLHGRVRLPEENRQELLALASERDLLAIVRVLLADTSPSGTAALDRAAAKRNRAIIEALVRAGADPARGSAFASACAAADVATIGLFLDAGASARKSLKAKNGLSPLLVVAASHGNGVAEAIALLVARGADLADRTDDNGVLESGTALHLAAGWGNRDGVDALIGAGADIAARDARGATPLHTAAERGSGRTLTALLDRGAPVDTLDAEGRTPLLVASENADFSQPSCVRRLLDAGAAPDAQDAVGRTALMRVVARGKREPALLLLERGATLELRDKRGRSALDEADALSDPEAFRAALRSAPRG